MVQKDVKMEGQVKTQREHNTTLTSRLFNGAHHGNGVIIFFAKF
jgi:hypothetical protein